jgi:hypothetical protein
MTEIDGTAIYDVKEAAKAVDMGIGQLSKREAKATPVAFRDLLIRMARSVKQPALEAAE